MKHISFKIILIGTVLELLLLFFLAVVVIALIARRKSTDTTTTHQVPVIKRPPPPPAVTETKPDAPPLEKVVLQGPAYVVDGDGLLLKKTEIRLFGVDAPEMNHPYGKNAKKALIKLCKGQTIRAEIVGKDTYDRSVARCYLSDGRDLSAELVKLGLALDWPKFSGGIYAELEPPDVRKKLWLAAARQKGHMSLWKKYEASQAAREKQN